MKPFRHFNADSVDEALALLTEYDGKARVTAGGTDLLGVLKSEILADYPEAVINLKTISGLDSIQADAAGMTPCTRVRTQRVVMPHGPTVHTRRSVRGIKRRLPNQASLALSRLMRMMSHIWNFFSVAYRQHAKQAYRRTRFSIP